MPFDSTGFEIAPQVVTEPWRKVLLDAADHLERYGWCSYAAHEAGKPSCAGLAIYRIGKEHGIETQVHLAKFLNLPPAWNETGDSAYIEALFRWNDTPGRTAAEVIAALRSCATA